MVIIGVGWHVDTVAAHVVVAAADAPVATMFSSWSTFS